jgi:hypothetical protein
MVFLTFGIILLFSNCKNENETFDEFYNTERENIINLTNEMFSKLGLENFEIIIYTNKSINNRIVSKQIFDTNWQGSTFVPEGPYSELPPAFRDLSDMNGRMRQRTMTVNYEPESKNEITYDSFSIIIIFEKINQRKKDVLLNIFDNYILNIERGDTIFIISKEEFNNFD